MTKQQRAPRKPKISIIFDTSALYTQSSGIVPDYFDKIFEHSGNLQIEILLPQIVLEELTRNCQANAKNRLVRLKSDTQFINEITDKDIFVDLKDEKIKQGINEHIARWVRKRKIKILPTPFEKLKLEEICLSAINKDGPFRDPNSDGFKDYLILRTLENTISLLKYRSDLYFVSHDKILSEEAKKIFKGKNHSEVIYMDTKGNELLEKLTILKQRLDEKKTAKIKHQAEISFFDISKKEGLWFSWVEREIAKDFEEQLNNPLGDNVVGLTSIYTKEWTADDGGTFYIGSPVLINKSSGDRYAFQTAIKFKRKFKRHSFHFPYSTLSEASGQPSWINSSTGYSGISSLSSEPLSQEVTHTMEVEFLVEWSAQNPKGIKLKDLKVESIKITSKNSPFSDLLTI